MEYISTYFDIDYFIVVHYDHIQKSVDLESIEIYSYREFNQFSPHYDKITIEKGYFKVSDLSITSNNNYIGGDSTNQILNEPIHNSHEKEKYKEDSISIRRINTASGNHSSSSNNNLLEENDINQINKIESKSTVNKNNNKKNDILRGKKFNEKIKKENNTDMGDTDELNNDEKFHNISQKYYRHLSLKDLSKEKIINNKNIKNDKLNKIKEIKNNQNDEKEIKEKKEIKTKNDIINKKYLFNESQLTIQLSSFEGESFKPVGLFNPNIYCFMICILQALLSIPELNYYFLSKIYLINNLNKSKNEQNNDNDLAICDAFHDFLKSYLLGKKYIEVPRSLKRICIQLLGGMRMHDCQEFFVCFLEALQEELNNKEKLNIPEKASMEQKWIIYRKVNNSFIDSIFTGLMRSCVQCKKCNFKSYTYDPFIDLSVSINKYKNLEKCLKQYFENEKIDCEYKCDNCKQISKVSINILNFFFLKILHLGHKKIGYYDTTTYFNYTI